MTSVTGIAYQGGGLIALRPGPNVLTSNTVYIAAGGPIKWRQVWATGSVYFEVNGYTTDSFYPAYFQLYDLTAGAQVVELTTTSTATTTILTSGALSLMDGHLYTVRAKSATMDGGRLVSAYLVVA
jgi:hypothetical protein